MHMADALVAPAVAATMYVASTAAAAHSVKRVRLEDEPKKIPAMGVMGAFVFAAQMVNFTIPGTGSSGHICGGVLLTAMLGPWAGFLAMTGILLIQCLLFADGGLLALGCNTWNMAFYACFVGGFLIWKPMMGQGMTKRKITVASILACVVTLQMGAFSVTLQTFFSGITELPFSVFVGVMQPIHLAIGLTEGVVTAAVLCFVYEARPEMLWGAGRVKAEGEGRLSFRRTLTVLVLLAAFAAGVLSLAASSLPDGLEWSMEKTAGKTELSADGSGFEMAVYEAADRIQRATALLPDYAFSSDDKALGTTVSGLVGGALVIALCTAVCYAFRFYAHGREKKLADSARGRRTGSSILKGKRQ